MAPATAVIMDDLGEAKAGDGGAVNQLARQVGGALGVAIIGTVFAAIYTTRSTMPCEPAGLAARPAGESIEQAQDVVATGRPASRAAARAVDDAFDVAARTGFGVAIARCCSAPSRARSACGGRR